MKQKIEIKNYTSDFFVEYFTEKKFSNLNIFAYCNFKRNT